MEQATNINKIASIVFGAVFALVGVLGFVGALAPEGKLLGIFAVSLMHNLVHLLTGVALLAGAFIDNGRMARSALLVFGSVYGLVTVLGIVANGLVNDLGIAVNTADNILHVALTLALLAVPLMNKETTVGTRSRAT